MLSAATALTFLFSSALWLQVSSQNLTTAAQISQSQGVRIEFDPVLSTKSIAPACTNVFVADLTVQLDTWVRDATHGALGFTVALPPLSLTASNDNTTAVRRDLGAADESHRDLLYNCNTCWSYACKVWCGCRLCSKDDDDVRSLRGSSRRRLQSSSEGTGSLTTPPTLSPSTMKEENKSDVVSKQVQKSARKWLHKNDDTGCMGIPEKLVVIVSFF